MTQKNLAKKVNTRANTISNYEKGKSTPKYSILINMSTVFNVNLDQLLLHDLSQKKLQFESKLTATTLYTDKEINYSNVVVPIKAQAGYNKLFFSEALEQDRAYINLPFFKTKSPKRTFEVQGDSMDPLFFDGDYVVCTAIESPMYIKNDSLYILVSHREGILLKRVFNDKSRQHYQLISTNTNYPPMIRHWKEINEVWEVRYRITKEIT